MFWRKSLFRKRPVDAQLDTELRFHIEKLTNDNIAAGMAPEEARRQAILEFGGREQVKEELRDVYRIGVIETTFTNVKSAFRFLRWKTTSTEHLRKIVFAPSCLPSLQSLRYRLPAWDCTER
jgi:hypothetical protein